MGRSVGERGYASRLDRWAWGYGSLVESGERAHAVRMAATPHTREVAGSNPAAPIRRKRANAGLLEGVAIGFPSSGRAVGVRGLILCLKRPAGQLSSASSANPH